MTKTKKTVKGQRTGAPLVWQVSLGRALGISSQKICVIGVGVEVSTTTAK